jgi:nitroreductase
MGVSEAVGSAGPCADLQIARPVPGKLRGALQSPSGGNLQPWNIYVVSGLTLGNMKAAFGSGSRSFGPRDPRARPLLAAVMRHEEHTSERLMQHLEHIRQDWSRPATHERPANAVTDDLHSGAPPDPPAASRE